jgi:hypothetical protein
MAQYPTHNSPPEREGEGNQVKATLDSRPMPAHACGSASETQDADNLIAIMVRPGQQGENTVRRSSTINHLAVTGTPRHSISHIALKERNRRQSIKSHIGQPAHAGSSRLLCTGDAVRKKLIMILGEPCKQGENTVQQSNAISNFPPTIETNRRDMDLGTREQEPT